jgi:hypothetical protein
MGRTAVIPAWVRPAPRQVADAHRISYALAHRPEFAAVEATVDWVTSTDPTVDDAHTQMAVCAPNPGGDAVRNTLAWLLGMQSHPPIRLPRRNPDGTPATAEDLFTEYMRGRWDGPEERRDARARAETDAALYRRLADLADSAH